MAKGYTVEELKRMVVARLDHINNTRKDEFCLPVAGDLAIVLKIKKEITTYSRLTYDIFARLFGQEDIAETLAEILRKTAKEEPVKMQGLHGVVLEMFGIEEEDDTDKIVVVTNKDMMFGAIAILYEGVVEKLCERLDTHKLIMIPSSIHEFLVMPFGDIDTDYINNTIKEVNETQVLPEERLADHAYVYGFDEGKPFFVSL